MTGFQPFGTDHAAALALLALAAWTIVRRGPAWSEPVRKGVAWSLAALTGGAAAGGHLRRCRSSTMSSHRLRRGALRFIGPPDARAGM